MIFILVNLVYLVLIVFLVVFIIKFIKRLSSAPRRIKDDGLFEMNDMMFMKNSKVK